MEEWVGFALSAKLALNFWLGFFANSKIAFGFGLLCAVAYFAFGRKPTGKVQKAFITASIGHGISLYVAVVLIVAALFGPEALESVITSGFGETEVLLAFGAMLLEAAFSLKRTFAGRSPT